MVSLQLTTTCMDLHGFPQAMMHVSKHAVVSIATTWTSSSWALTPEVPRPCDASLDFRTAGVLSAVVERAAFALMAWDPRIPKMK